MIIMRFSYKTELENITIPQKIVLAQTTTSTKRLLHLSKESDEKVRVETAKNLDTSPYVLKKLSTDKNMEVRKAVAGNPRTSIHILKTMLYNENEDDDVRLIVIKNLNHKASMKNMNKISIDFPKLVMDVLNEDLTKKT